MRPVLASVLVTVAAGCSTGGTAGDGLEAALARVADTANNRSAIYYDNTTELVTLTGKDLRAETNGYAQLRGQGAIVLLSTLAFLTADSGIKLFDENYAISTGTPPNTLMLIAGGQDASLVTGRLTKEGWKKDADGTLAGPPPLAAGGSTGAYASFMRQVRTANSDVLAGGSAADLGQLGSPPGKTLADDAGISALAHCLGNNVVAATIFEGNGITVAPTEVAVGISKPASASATPHAVVCVSWPSQAAAGTYVSNVRKALATGLSPATSGRFSTQLLHATVTSVGGSTHVVKWQADTPVVDTVFVMQEDRALPALQDCSQLKPAQKAQVIGCG